MKKLMKTLFVMFMISSLASCTIDTVEPGQEGFMFKPWGDGVISDVTYTSTSQVVAAWNDLIVYDVLQKSRNYTSDVLEKNGMEVGIEVNVNYNAMRGKTPFLHTAHGMGYEQSFVDVKVRGAIKAVIGRYTYEEIYSTKRDVLETEIDEILQSEFEDNFINYNFCEIADVNLPEPVREAITAKEEQKQKNQKAKELEQEQEFIANAMRTKAQGEKDARILRAEGKSKEIQLIQTQLSKSPNYNEYVRSKGFADGKGSYFGTGNVFGVQSASVIKGLK